MSAEVLTEQSWELEPAALSARAAREHVRALLDAAGRLDWVDAAALAVSEVVTNAVLHAHTAIRVCARIDDDGLLVEVHDLNPTLPSPRSYDTHATTGRGMDLVAAVTTAHGVHGSSSGKVVWFRLTDAGQAEGSGEDLLAQWDDSGWDDAGWDGAGWGDEGRGDEGRGDEGRGDGEQDGGEQDGGEQDDAEQDDAEPGDRDTDVRTVVLRGMPPTLWLAAREHHDALLRESVLFRAEHPDDPGSQADLARADEARFTVSGRLEAEVDRAREEGLAVRPLPEYHPGALPSVPERLDLVLEVRPEQAGAFAALQDALDDGERLARDGRLLVRPGLPEIVAVRDWACEQVIAQLGGAPAAPWSGADDERFTGAIDPTQGLSWDDTAVRTSSRGVVAADDGNRILAVSAPLAAALGWDPDDLVGRRIVAIVPHRYREAHVAGFSRHLSTGDSRVLGVSIDLPVLKADGSEVLCHFLIESDRTAVGHAVYLAWITPTQHDVPA